MKGKSKSVSGISVPILHFWKKKRRKKNFCLLHKLYLGKIKQPYHTTTAVWLPAQPLSEGEFDCGLSIRIIDQRLYASAQM